MAAPASASPGAMAAPGPGLSMGVEEEFVLVGAPDGRPAPGSDSVLRRARRDGPPADVQLKHELLAAQVEMASGVCSQLGELMAQLRTGRRLLAASARDAGLLLLSTGTPVDSAVPAALTRGARYRQIADRYAGVIADYEVCGCHVHVGVPDRETAVAVANHLRPWLPSLLALSANSPFHQGRDTGYASWRMVLQSRFPGSGVPPYFPSAAAYEAELGRLVECGALVDDRQSFWLARPSPSFPTVELRVADAAGTVEEAALQAALSRGLVRTALAALDAGREAVPVPDQIAAAAVWTASRHGLAGPSVHPRHERRVPAGRLVHELLDHVSAALEETADLAWVRQMLAAVEADGTGAERQRGAAAGGHRSVVEHLAAETEDGGSVALRLAHRAGRPESRHHPVGEPAHVRRRP